MNRYQVMLSDDLESAYREIAEQLNMSMDQVLSSALQIYAEHLTLETYNGICNTERVRSYNVPKRKVVAK